MDFVESGILLFFGLLGSYTILAFRDDYAKRRDYIAERRECYRASIRALASMNSALQLLERAAVKTDTDLDLFQKRHDKLLDVFEAYNGERDVIAFYVSDDTKIAFNELDSAMKDYAVAIDGSGKITDGTMAAEAAKLQSRNDARNSAHELFVAWRKVHREIKKEYASLERNLRL